jgi:hypothetical protein
VKELDQSASELIVSDPLLIDNKKFDLRIYVLIMSCDPLRIYLFRDGLVRLCTQDFSKPNSSNLDNICMHLSNYSINKRSDEFSGSEDVTGSSGSKRSIKWFLSWLADKKGDDVADMLWCKIGHICVKTILCIEPILLREYRTTFGLNVQSSAKTVEEQEHQKEVDRINVDSRTKVTHTTTDGNIVDESVKSKEGGVKKSSIEKHIIAGSRSIAILGFDIMIDSKMKPHLIEVNHLPSFGTDSALDESVKSRVVLQALSAIQASASDQQSHASSIKKLRQNRLLNKGTSGINDIRNEMGGKRGRLPEMNPSTIQTTNKEKILMEEDNVIDVEKFVTEIYSIHAPEKIDKVDVLLQKYQGHEDWLVKKLKEKYCSNSVLDSIGAKEEDINDGEEINNTNKIVSRPNAMNSENDEHEFIEDCTLEDDSCHKETKNEEVDDVKHTKVDQSMVYEDEILVEKGDYERIYPPKKGKFKSPAYGKMREHATEEDFKSQMRLVCPLWQLRKYERHDENVTAPEVKREAPREAPRNEKINVGYYSRGDWLIHGNVHRKSEPIPTKVIPLPSQKQLEAAERLSRGFSVNDTILISEEEASKVETNNFVTRLSLAEQVGKDIRKKNEEKFISRSQLNMNPVNIAFGDISSSSRARPYSASGERCYVDFTGRKV